MFALVSYLRNVVGYQTQALYDNTFTMVYVPFVHVNNDGEGLQLNKDITVDGVKGGDNCEVADRIWIWNGEGGYYRFFYYLDPGVEEGWVDDVNLDWIQDIEGWEDGIASGTGMYFKAKGADKSVIFYNPLVEQKD